MNKLCVSKRKLIVLAFLSLILLAASARQQGAAHATITSPDLSHFPSISTYLNAFDDQDNFITELRAADVSVLENGQEIAPDLLEAQATPLSFVLAVNSDPTLAMRDALGVGRYDSIIKTLEDWVARQPAESQDKLALVWNGGQIATKMSPAEWKTRVDGFDPALRTSKTGLNALAFALDASSEAASGPGIKKSVLLVSGHLGQKEIDGLGDLIKRAKLAEVRVFVWITDTKSYLNTPGSQALEQLAQETGGKSIKFSGSEELPDLETWFSSLRIVYKVSYTSKIRAGRQQTLTVQVSNNGMGITSEPAKFDLDIQPPSAALLSAPINITRQNPETPFDLESFLPVQQKISILVEFPDGMIRNLKRTSLYVDEKKIAENLAEPFTSFNWDLSGYLASSEHVLKVEVEDGLGLSRTSADVPVQVTIVQPPGGVAGMILRNRSALTISLLVLAGALALGIIILGGRKGWATLAERRKAFAAKHDPVTQPVTVVVEKGAAAGANPFPWLKRKESTAPASLERLNPDGSAGSGEPIALHGLEITFGSDPTQATIVLDHPSISLLHARLLRSVDDASVYTLLDQKSVAGTWVNYDQITPAGRALAHGDVIQFGSLSFCFELAKPPKAIKPTVTPISEK